MMEYTLSNPHLRMRVSPQGASLLELEDNECQPLLRKTDIANPWHPSESALFTMLPLANRVAGNRFNLWGNEYLLPEPDSAIDPHFFLHGDGWLKLWQPIARTSSSVTLQLTSHNEPFHYQAEVDYRLQGKSLVVRISLIHLGEKPCLYGCGFHPFFWRDELTRIRFLAGGVWLEGEDHLPTSWTSKLASQLDFRQWNYPQGWLNHCYGNWNGKAEIEHPIRNQKLTIASDMSFLMLYQPDEKCGFVCLEPQSHAINAHCMAGYPGLRVLSRGDKMSFYMSVTESPLIS